MTENTIKTEEAVVAAAPAPKAKAATAAKPKKAVAPKVKAEAKAAKAPKAAKEPKVAKQPRAAKPKHVAKAPAKKAVKAKAPQAAQAAAGTTVKITLVKSLIGRLEAHKACARGLGLSKIRQTIEVADTVENRGMISRISYLLNIKV